MVPAGAGGDWCGPSGALMSPEGVGGSCGARFVGRRGGAGGEVGWRLCSAGLEPPENAISTRCHGHPELCPQSRVPPATSCPPCGCREAPVAAWLQQLARGAAGAALSLGISLLFLLPAASGAARVLPGPVLPPQPQCWARSLCSTQAPRGAAGSPVGARAVGTWPSPPWAPSPAWGRGWKSPAAAPDLAG